MLFEGGEAESFVLDAPLFKKNISITKATLNGQEVLEGTVSEAHLSEALPTNLPM